MGTLMEKLFLPKIGSSKSRKPSIKDSNTACHLLGIKLGLPTANRTATINKIEMTHVVRIELVSGKPKISVNSYGDGLTPPSAACSAVVVAERKSADGSSLFT